MPPPTVPKIIQRFRAYEVQRLANAAGYIGGRKGKAGNLQSINVDNLQTHTRLHNPFLPHPLFERTPLSKETSTTADAASSESEPGQPKKERKKWAPPRVSLRRQVELVKAARASGTLHLLPPGPKLSVTELQAAKLEFEKQLYGDSTTDARAGSSAAPLARSEDTGEMVGNVGPASAEANAATTTPSSTFVSSLDGGHSTEGRQETEELRDFRIYQNSRDAGYPGVDFQWEGEVPLSAREKNGWLTVYAGRKRMFKGHKWERALKKRRGQIRMRLRDMRKRIARFRSVHKRWRPRPLAPPKPRKKESLPF